MRRIMLCIISAVLALVSYGGMLIALRDFAGAYRSITVQLQTPCTVGDAKQVLEAYPQADWALYAQRGEETIQSEELRRPTDVTAIYLAGNPARYAHLPVNGVLPGIAAERTCAIDRETALRLWGSAEAQGLSLLHKGEEYTVCGILDVKGRLMMLAAADDDSLDYLTFSDETGYALAEQIAGQMGGAKAIYVDGEALVWLRLWIYALPLVIFIMLSMYVYIYLPGNTKTMRRLRKIILSGTITACIFVAIALILKSIPLRMLPNRWSDFSAYADVFKNAASPFGDVGIERWSSLRTDAGRLCLFGGLSTIFAFTFACLLIALKKQELIGS